MKELILSPATIKIIIWIASIFGTLFLLSLSIIGYFLKRLITKVDNVEKNTTDFALSLNNATKDISFVSAEVINIKKRLDKHDEETMKVRDRLKALETYMEMNDE